MDGCVQISIDAFIDAMNGLRFLCKMKTNLTMSLWKPNQVLLILKTLSINVLIRLILYDRGAKLR